MKTTNEELRKEIKKDVWTLIVTGLFFMLMAVFSGWENFLLGIVIVFIAYLIQKEREGEDLIREYVSIFLIVLAIAIPIVLLVNIVLDESNDPIYVSEDLRTESYCEERIICYNLQTWETYKDREVGVSSERIGCFRMTEEELEAECPLCEFNCEPDTIVGSQDVVCELRPIGCYLPETDLTPVNKNESYDMLIRVGNNECYQVFPGGLWEELKEC